MSYEAPENIPAPMSDTRLQDIFVSAMTRVYLWMSLGLILTAAVAILVTNVPVLMFIIFGNPIVFWGLIIGELIMVLAISRVVTRLSAGAGLTLFFIYAIMNGATLSFIFLVYELGSIGLTFAATAVTFGLMSLIGFVTKEDLTKWGNILLIGLVGLLVGSIVNVLLASTAFDWFLTYFGILIFLGLTVYDTQRIKKMTIETALTGDEQVVSKVAVWGALRLYLDFINLFLRLLRIMGRRR